MNKKWGGGGLHVGVYHSENMVGRQHEAAAAQFCSADERMSKKACLVQTPTLPGLVSKKRSNTLLRLSLLVALCVSLFIMPCFISVHIPS